MNITFARFAACVLSVSLLGGPCTAAEQLLVHEWGTFTALQNEAGEELPGINIDDEPVPAFVHNLSRFLLNSPLLVSDHWRYRQKAVPRQHPRVTMRLETPVIYFYPPSDAELPLKLDLSVEFHGGWLTEFYPRAEANAPGLRKGTFEFGELTAATVGSLAWNGLQVGTRGGGPETDAEVWNAPRRVAAAPVTIAEGDESEKYLFYRGVANLPAPLRIALARPRQQLTIRGNFDNVLHEGQSAALQTLWLVHVRNDGQMAWREVFAAAANHDRQRALATASYAFAEQEYSEQQMDGLQQAMRNRLIAEGLFADEAEALLSTWQRAYFVTPGLRLFFLVPRPWTDRYLPMTLSCAAEVQRVMVGRIEMISDEQRATLDRLCQLPTSDAQWIDTIPESPAREAFLSGRSHFGDLRVPIPADFQLYLSLGRFRNALVTAEAQRASADSLRQFISNYRLEPFPASP